MSLENMTVVQYWHITNVPVAEMKTFADGLGPIYKERILYHLVMASYLQQCQ
jgi:hypothetical protein